MSHRHQFSSITQIHPSLPTGTAIIKTLLATFGQLKPKHLYILGLLGWPSPLVTRSPPEQPRHVLNEDGTIRMRRAHNVRGGWAPWKPMLGAPYPDHPFQSMKYFKSKILDPLEERSLIQTLRVPYPLLTPQDHASSLLASLKSTRRRQRELAATPEIGLGTGFRLKGQAKKEWEDKVYGLEVEKEEVREWKDEWVVRVGGLDVEGEEYKRLKEDWGSGARETQKDPVEFGPTSAEDKAFYPPESLDIPDLVPSKTLPHLLLNPNLIPPHLLPDPRTESPLPLPPKSDLPTPSLLHTHLTLSHPSIHPRWASAIAGELTARKILIMEEEEAKARKVERRQMYSKLREGKRRLKDEEMRNLVEGGEGREGDELRGKVEGIRGGREFKFWEKDARMVSQGGGAGAGAGVRVKREDRAGSWRVEAEKSGKYGLRRGASALESRA